MKTAIKDLRLADVVDLGFNPWGSAIVKKITDLSVTLFRPYGTTADFECGGSVICYTGYEEINYHIDSSHKLNVVQKGNLK